MSGPTDPTYEISELMRNSSTPVLLKKALQLFMAADARLARDAADKLDELCERRLATEGIKASIEQADATNLRPTQSDLNDGCDVVTGRLMKYLGKLTAENERTGGAQLVLFAAARSLICTSASVSGVEEGLKDVRLVFEESLKDLTPILREMPETGI